MNNNLWGRVEVKNEKEFDIGIVFEPILIALMFLLASLILSFCFGELPMRHPFTVSLFGKDLPFGKVFGWGIPFCCGILTFMGCLAKSPKDKDDDFNIKGIIGIILYMIASMGIFYWYTN